MLDIPQQRIADYMREGAGPGRGKAENLQTMRERRRQPARAAIFDVVMDRVIIGGKGLKRRKMGLGHGAARDRKALADPQILEPTLVSHSVTAGIKSLGHRGSRRRSTPLAASSAIAPAS